MKINVLENMFEKLMHEGISVFTLDDKEIRIKQDEFYNPFDDCGNPSFFNLLKRYNIGEKEIDGLDYTDFENIQEIEDYLNNKGYIWTRVGAYIHGGIALYSEGNKPRKYSYGWDYGCAGYAYYTKEQVREIFGVKRISAKLKDKLYKDIEIFIKELEAYLEGNIYTLYVDDIPEETFIGYNKEQMLQTLERFAA
ncbi:TPA: hypothetical protein ACSPVW_001352 [Campylobacter coli]|uniref:hypothetical protein n=1 Tax=Campylobacter coli TaxID=195 RepID=UPI0002582B7F|nr:hypothetical protein [Campylobacter coli]EAI0449325.1 hypothetical protein [Campylobacter coli]EAI4223259.1 hypothetical protein [Campylobacter coli]EAI6901550.1 hypothetical protein [Campylobacter coli]EAI7846290.1 hypothetical protein [Campylobacter coli]EAJ0416662.1 hypothetical protein [Campylobacter coli]